MRSNCKHLYRGYLLVLAFGVLINLLLAYACWWRAGSYGFGPQGSGLWLDLSDDDLEYIVKGRTFGVTAWIEQRATTSPHGWNAPPDYDITGGGTIHTITDSELGFGWPLRSIGNTSRHEETETFTFSPERTRPEISVEEVDRTPPPHWYHKGLDTGHRNWILGKFPIALRPLGLVLNSVLYGVISYCLAIAWKTILRRRRARSGLCTACGYGALGLTRCPECGATRT